MWSCFTGFKLLPLFWRVTSGTRFYDNCIQMMELSSKNGVHFYLSVIWHICKAHYGPGPALLHILIHWGLKIALAGTCYHHHLHFIERTQKHGDEQPTPGHTASKQQSQDLNPSSVGPQSVSLTILSYCSSSGLIKSNKWNIVPYAKDGNKSQRKQVSATSPRRSLHKYLLVRWPVPLSLIKD